LEDDADVFHGSFLSRIDEQDEFVSSHPTGFVILPYGFPDDFCDFLQYLVSNQMSEVVVDEFEIVYVDEQERK
jgi:hypothetical protein